MKPLTYISIAIIITSLCVTTMVDTFIVETVFMVIGLLSIGTLIYSLIRKPDLSNNENTAITEPSLKTSANNNLNELNQLFELLESAVKEDLIVVKQELYQIKSLVNTAVEQLSESFYSVSNNSIEQQRLIKILIDTLNTANNEKALTQLGETQQQIQTSSAMAVQSLQFEDIVVQVSDNSIQYIDNLDNFLKEFRMRLENQLDSDDKDNQLKCVVDDVKNIRKNRLLPDRKAAYQNNMTQGDVELF